MVLTGPPTGEGPLAGVKVVEMSTTLMAPYAAMILAQMGADTIKVEAPGGDINRNVADVTGVGMAAGFIAANLGKRSVVLDLKDPDDRVRFHDLIRWADVFVHNRPPSASVRLGVDYASLKDINPRLIHCAAFGFGSAGPYRDLPAYDDVIQAASGLAYLENPDKPEYVRSAIADKISGLMIVGAVNAALYERERSGEGQSVEVPMFESLASLMLVEQQQGWVFDPPRGPTVYSRTSSPFRKPYRTLDGVVSVVIYTDRHWDSFFALLGRPELSVDERFSTVRARTENIDELYAMVEEELSRRTSAEWIEVLRANNIPVMPVNSLTDLFEDPHLAAVGFWSDGTQPQLGRTRTARLPVSFSRTPTGPTRPAPMLGEHNEILEGDEQ